MLCVCLQHQYGLPVDHTNMVCLSTVSTWIACLPYQHGSFFCYTNMDRFSIVSTRIVSLPQQHGLSVYLPNTSLISHALLVTLGHHGY